MSEKIIVPVLGESITEATVSKWLKNEGDEVKTDEPIVELETDKVNLEVPSPISGKLTEIISKNGSVVEVGAHLGSIEKIGISEKQSQKIEKIKPTVKRENIENSEPSISHLTSIKSSFEKFSLINFIKSIHSIFVDLSFKLPDLPSADKTLPIVPNPVISTKPS